MERNVVYTAIFFDEEELKRTFKPVHQNLFYHHSTIGFKPDTIDDLNIGERIKVKILGRLTTEIVDCLLVDNKFSKNKYPHITLSTANGIKPFMSNKELEDKNNEIKYYKNDIIFNGIIGYFDGQKDVTKESESRLSNIIKEELDKVYSIKSAINSIDFAIKNDKRNGISFNREIWSFDEENSVKKIYVDLNKNNTKELPNKTIPLIGFEVFSLPNSNKIDRIDFDQSKENGIYKYLGHGNEYDLTSRFDKKFFNLLNEFIKSYYSFVDSYEEPIEKVKNNVNKKKEERIELKPGFLTIIKDILKKQRNDYVIKIVSNIEKNEGKATQRQFDYLKRFRTGEIKQTDYSSKN